MCRLGGEKEETTFHILCHCSKIVATGYKKMHDGVAKIVNWNLTRQYGFKTSKKWYKKDRQKQFCKTKMQRC